MPTREDAWTILCEYTQSESLRKHMLAVEACVRAYARKNGADEETWGLAALLHDFDYERWPNNDHAADRERDQGEHREGLHRHGGGHFLSGSPETSAASSAAPSRLSSPK